MTRHSVPNPVRRLACRGLAAAALVVAVAEPCTATTLQRMGLEKLTQIHSTIVVGQVVDSFSYWNDEGTAILTDVTVEPESMLKGRQTKTGPLTVTLLGGEVDGLQQVLLGGADLQVGQSYVLFVAESDLPGAPGALTVPGHSQGVFDILLGADGALKARSQASGLHLLADRRGVETTPGGAEGFDLDHLLTTVSRTIEAQRDEIPSTRTHEVER
ncbi:MAG: hypothetical protein AAGE94_14240 [Acidobacteriota bacterium]